MKREMQRLIKLLKRNGYTVVPTKNGHYKVTGQGCGIVFLSGSPSNPRAVRMAMADLSATGISSRHN